MVKPLQELVFHHIMGMWQTPTGNILADVLAEYEIIVDDRTQFARLYDYARGIVFYYRASAGKVTLTLWRLGQ